MSIQQINVGPGTAPIVYRARLRDAVKTGRLAIDGDTGVTYVLRYNDIKPLLTDKRTIGGGRALFDMQNVPAGPLPDWFHSIMFSNEGPAHHRMRLLVQKAFTPRAIEGLRETAAKLVAERLAPIREAGTGDLMKALADLPMQMMCALIGAPSEDAPMLIDWVNDLGPIFGQMTPAQIAAASAAISQMLAYSIQLRSERLHTPASDLMTELIAAEEDGDRLTPDETAALVANLIIGGYDTTVSQIGCTVLTMITHPEAMADVDAHPEILDSAVSECFRYETGVPLTWREVIEPFEIDGTTCAKGSVLFVNMLTANRDPTAWPDADSFQPRRFMDPDAQRLIAFGGGMHHCLGSWLARMTIGEVIRGVSALRPTLAANPADLEWEQVLGQNPKHLPVFV
ncbi:MAG: cytochrome P450 [Sphingobium sp.]|uniref:cytochrome P450 n=1 Tax=Sphingobium sp. TaxID=1912891 RepID=UPI0029AFD234|nr:cytochrome P450 [Sphingobium sp.]MDX3910214.1 cytochrome P450 [Sphingobium sp.]